MKYIIPAAVVLVCGIITGTYVYFKKRRSKELGYSQLKEITYNGPLEGFFIILKYLTLIEYITTTIYQAKLDRTTIQSVINNAINGSIRVHQELKTSFVQHLISTAPAPKPVGGFAMIYKITWEPDKKQLIAT